MMVMRRLHLMGSMMMIQQEKIESLVGISVVVVVAIIMTTVTQRRRGNGANE